MAEWRIQDDGEVKTMPEEKVRRELRGGAVRGDEPARPGGDTDWKPLHDWPIFREEFPFQGDPAAAARRRLIFPLLWHVLPFVAVGSMLGWPPWMAFWGVGVFAHGLSV